MRSREKIEQDLDDAGPFDLTNQVAAQIIAELLLDVREELVQLNMKVTR